MYITFNNETKRVTYIGEKKPISKTDNATLAEVDTIPEKYDYLTVVNEREKSEVYKVFEEISNEKGELELVEVEKTRIYTTCDLIINFKPQPTLEEIEKQKEKEYKELTKRLIRQKYSQSDVEAIINNYLDDSEKEKEKEKYKNEFDELQNYRKECKAKAKLEVYGG